jgi:hypothetical protein
MSPALALTTQETGERVLEKRRAKQAKRQVVARERKRPITHTTHQLSEKGDSDDRV